MAHKCSVVFNAIYFNAIAVAKILSNTSRSDGLGRVHEARKVVQYYKIYSLEIHGCEEIVQVGEDRTDSEKE